jgi:hypothetical protein
MLASHAWLEVPWEGIAFIANEVGLDKEVGLKREIGLKL